MAISEYDTGGCRGSENRLLGQLELYWKPSIRVLSTCYDLIVQVLMTITPDL